MKFLLRLGLVALALATSAWVGAAERIPPPPARHFNDYANVVSPAVAADLNAKLESFERSNSTQLVVAIFPRMESDSSVADYTVRVAEAWKVGQRKQDNGAVLFAFMAQREVYLQVGYGLEAVLPDALAKRIIETEIVPRFRAGDIDGGMKAAVNAMMAAAKGEYRGTGKTVNEQKRGTAPGGIGVLALVIAMVILRAIFAQRSRRTYVFGGPRGGWWLGPPGGGGGWSSGGGGGFSGGGGSFGGGGAGGKW